MRAAVMGNWLAREAVTWSNEAGAATPVAATVRDFNGWRWPHAFVGWNETHVLATVSSAPAMLAASGPFADHGWKCSRLDVQATSSMDVLLPEGWSREVRAAHLEGCDRRAGVAPQCVIYDGGRLGETVYIGAPSSDKRLVIYDKGAESKSSIREVLRIEMRYRRGVAAQSLEVLRTYPVAYQPSICAQWCSAGAGHMPGVREWAWNEALEVTAPKVTQDATTDETRLAWLQNQVAPTVQRLLTVYDRHAILAILGLD